MPCPLRPNGGLLHEKQNYLNNIFLKLNFCIYDVVKAVLKGGRGNYFFAYMAYFV